MNKLLQYMIGAGNVSDKFLPHLAKAQKGFTALPTFQKAGQVQTKKPIADPRVFPQETLANRQKVYKTVRPTDYTDLKNYIRYVFNNERDEYDDARSEEAFKMYLGLQPKPEYFRPSKYKPTINADPNGFYYSADDQLEQDIFESFKDKVKPGQIVPTDEYFVNSYFPGNPNAFWEGDKQMVKFGPNDENPFVGRPMVSRARALGKFVVSRGSDKQGDYLSYADQYDFPEKLQDKMQGQPYKIYGRVYYPKDKKAYGGFFKQKGGQTVTNPFWEGSYDFKPINQGTVDEIKSEMAGYIQSPLYAQRQAMHPERYIGNNLSYYEDPKAFQNSTASAKRSYRLMDLYDQPSQIKNIGKFKDYYDPKKRKTVLNSSNLESVVAHELGHSLFKGEALSTLLDSDYDNSKYWDDLAAGNKTKFGTSLNKAEVDKFKSFAYPIANEDEHYDNRGYGDFANESYADLTGIRHLLYKNGLTKKFGDNINRTIYEKALKNKQIQNDPVFKRMQQKYSPGKIILLNNTIAQNTDAKSDVDMAQYGGPILDPRGQWAHPGKVTRIPGSNITMQGVNYSVYGVGSNGQQQMMQPGQEYNFGGASYVDEYPMMQNGGLLSRSVTCSNCGWSWKAVDGGHDPMTCHKCGGMIKMKNGGQHGGLDRWFAEKWVDVKSGKACGRQEGESRKGYPACRPSKRVNSQTPKTASEMSPAEKAKFKASKTSSERISYNHKRNK